VQDASACRCLCYALIKLAPQADTNSNQTWVF